LGTLVLKAGTLTSNGKLVLASNASQTAIVDDFFEGNPSSTIAGTMTVERHVQNPPAIAFPGYHGHYIGSPLIGANVSGWADDFDVSVFNGAVNGTPVIPRPNCDPSALAAGSPYGRIYTYHEDLLTFCYLEGWRVRTGAHSVNRGIGFSANIPTTGVIDQTGIYSNADVVFNSLSNSASSTFTFHKALHLVSNPFCAPVDWAENYALNGGAGSDIDGNAYLYNPNGGVWVVYNGTNLGVIGTSQAFHIRANNTIRATNNPFNFTLHEDARVTNGNNTFYRQRANYAFGYSINLTGPNSRWDKTTLVFDDNFTNQFDNFYDADKMMSTPGSPSLYTKMPDGYNLAIQALPVNTNIITVPLSLKPEINGSFNLDFEELQSLPGTMMVTLEDTYLNVFQNIRVNNQYTFTASINDNPDRFLIHFTPQLVASVVNATCSGNNDAFIALDQQGGVEWNYNLVDANNNVVASGVSFTGLDTINNLSPGTYILQLSHLSGYTTSEVYTVSGVQLVDATLAVSATTVEQNEMITLDAASATATNYTWDMGDGTVYNNLSTVEHSYAQAGTYDIVLIADNGVCSNNQTLQIVVNSSIVTSILSEEAGKLWAYHYADNLYFKQTLNNESTTLNATLYNALGQIVVAVSESNLVYNQVFTAPLENIASGTYVLHTKAGDKVTVRKIVINK